MVQERMAFWVSGRLWDLESAVRSLEGIDIPAAVRERRAGLLVRLLDREGKDRRHVMLLEARQSAAALFRQAAGALLASVPEGEGPWELRAALLHDPQPCGGPEDVREGALLCLVSRGRTCRLFPDRIAEAGLSATGCLETMCGRLDLPPGTWRDKSARMASFALWPLLRAPEGAEIQQRPAGAS